MEERFIKIIKLIGREYPEPRTALVFKTPFQLLVATILSAQTTDERVNKVMSAMTLEYKEPGDFAAAPVEDIEERIRTVNYYKTKAKNIKALSKELIDRFQGRVPETIGELITLPGVARKTANVVLSGAFGIHEGIVVDTHVRRLSNRLGLTKQHNPEKIERELMQKIPQKNWDVFSLGLILHGRAVCKARKPACAICVLEKYCTYSEKTT